MTDFRKRIKINRALVNVSGVSPVVIIPEQDGITIGLTQLFAVNLSSAIAGLTLYEETTQILPIIAVGASGTFIWDVPGGGQLELTTSSGLYAQSTPVDAEFSITALYITHDDRAPITKSEARTASLNPIITRQPNKFGN